MTLKSVATSVALLFAASLIALGSATSVKADDNGGSSSAGNPPPHGARDLNQEILAHSVVTSVESLLNEKYAGGCTLPTKTDIQWRCLGAIPQVTVLTITPSSCFFSVPVKCPGDTATISGTTTSYFLNVPAGSTASAEPTDTIIVINNVAL